MAKRSGHMRKFNDPADEWKPPAKPVAPTPAKAKKDKPAAEAKADVPAEPAAPSAEAAKKDGE